MPIDKFWCREPTRLEAEKHLGPAIGAFTDPVLNGHKVLFLESIDANDNEQAEPFIAAGQPAVSAICPNVAPFIAAKIGYAPVLIFRRQWGFRRETVLPKKPLAFGRRSIISAATI